MSRGGDLPGRGGAPGARGAEGGLTLGVWTVLELPEGCIPQGMRLEIKTNRNKKLAHRREGPVVSHWLCLFLLVPFSLAWNRIRF